MFKFPKLPRADLPRIAAWVNLLRDVAALLFVPVVCIYASILVWMLWVFAHKGPESVTLKVVDAYSFALYGSIAVIALGSLWYQKRGIKASGSTPGGAGFNVDIDDDEPTVAKVETTTTVEVK